ncbi:hypothetical protein J7E97_22635 [Streptomyces sp. ISL-66]|uniref:hypothetical protein n=1 Tax=Streptomyces sp. ISL-66 TaxID=2819186 RepID=UPI001BE60BFC|nr:hypothetical protein [Streptomyces sp. ISL-66]MBT2470586.1 hypothetical protein [Streptomyces sp. ISL-66]
MFAPESGLVNGEAFGLLAGMMLLFTTIKDMKRFDRNIRNRSRRQVPVDGWKMQHTEAVPAGPPAPKAPRKATEPRCRRASGPCACPEPRLTAVISGQAHLAEPCELMTPAAAVYTASCRTCGGLYDKPGRRIRPWPGQPRRPAYRRGRVTRGELVPGRPRSGARGLSPFHGTKPGTNANISRSACAAIRTASHMKKRASRWPARPANDDSRRPAGSSIVDCLR